MSLPEISGAVFTEGVEETRAVVAEDFVAEPWLFVAVCTTAIRFPAMAEVTTRLVSELPSITEQVAVISAVPALTMSLHNHHW